MLRAGDALLQLAVLCLGLRILLVFDPADDFLDYGLGSRGLGDNWHRAALDFK